MYRFVKKDIRAMIRGAYSVCFWYERHIKFNRKVKVSAYPIDDAFEGRQLDRVLF